MNNTKPLSSDVPYIEVDVNAEGHVQIEAHNYTGGTCLQATAEIEQAIGRITNRVKKPSFYQRIKTAAKQTLGGGA